MPSPVWQVAVPGVPEPLGTPHTVAQLVGLFNIHEPESTRRIGMMSMCRKIPGDCGKIIILIKGSPQIAQQAIKFAHVYHNLVSQDIVSSIPEVSIYYHKFLFRDRDRTPCPLYRTPQRRFHKFWNNLLLGWSSISLLCMWTYQS